MVSRIDMPDTAIEEDAGRIGIDAMLIAKSIVSI